MSFESFVCMYVHFFALENRKHTIEVSKRRNEYPFINSKNCPLKKYTFKYKYHFMKVISKKNYKFYYLFK